MLELFQQLYFYSPTIYIIQYASKEPLLEIYILCFKLVILR